MPTYQKCPKAVGAIAHEILEEFPTHRPTLNAEVTIDFVFAYADVNDEGIATNNALTLHGTAALAICKKIRLKDRVMGRADVEIAIDGRWWETASPAECRALLDHELTHIEVKVDENGICRDDASRPLIKLRKHDFQIGWFSEIAARHGKASQEVIQAKMIMDQAGQLYWPDICSDKPNPASKPWRGEEAIVISQEQFNTAAAAITSALKRKKGRK